jgi:TolA-binding protein
VLAASLFLGSGCATTGEHKELAARVTSLERERTTLVAQLNLGGDRMERLYAQLVAAEEALRRAGAELSLRLDRLEQQGPGVRGDLESLAFKLRTVDASLAVIKRELSDRLGSSAVYLPADLPRDADGLWSLAENRLAARELAEARALFELFAASHEKDPRAPRAFFRLGEAYEATGDLENARNHYQRVYDRFPDSPEAPGAVMRIAGVFVTLGDCKRAKVLLQFVESNFRKAPEAATAKARQRTVLGECKGD